MLKRSRVPLPKLLMIVSKNDTQNTSRIKIVKIGKTTTNKLWLTTIKNTKILVLEKIRSAQRAGTRQERLSRLVNPIGMMIPTKNGKINTKRRE
jgi:hypothetical protein